MSQIVKKGQTVLGAGATNANVLSGSNVEFINGPALVSLYASATVVGNSITFQNGSAATFVDDSAANVASAAGIVRKDTDGMCEQVLVNGAHLILKLFDSGGAGCTINWLVIVEPIPAGM